MAWVCKAKFKDKIDDKADEEGGSIKKGLALGNEQSDDE